ncbi:choline/ethanolamine kinase family protein [Salipiger sp. 1_MG-2023]|uniref:choline/ethanolamine kinase family protein n=1 Tax=Salipiger sp. 1_MG-2023 TaxID=3062665 RepID=UPI0026E22A6D|nr:choline/ethanolamine kinase family protein [Salipiger sp. 1_MG-2023]MDO6587424.1 choline/ethanolamine kinase family protein [Salipiger sp. 1_MG-2023]
MTPKRRIGEARTQDEHSAEAAIRSVPGWQGREDDIVYRMMVGGLNNHNWHISVAGDPRSYFLKIPGAGTEIFINRATSYEAAVFAHGVGIAPEVIFHDPASGTEVHEFLEGHTTCTTADFMRPKVRDQVIRLFRTLHSGPVLSEVKTIFDLIDEHLQQAAELGSSMPEDLPWLLYHYEKIRAAFAASGMDLVTCYNDPMPGNFLFSPSGELKLIDYEFASANERSYDIGVFACEMFLEEDETDALIETYFGQVTAQMQARVALCRILADLKWGSWAVVNRRLSDWDFDFQKYGLWKYMRGRALISDPRFDRWLRLA